MKVWIIVEYDDWNDTDRVYKVYKDKSKAEIEQKRLQKESDEDKVKIMTKDNFMSEELVRAKYLTHLFHIEEHDVIE